MGKFEIVPWEDVPQLVYRPEYTVEEIKHLFDEGKIRGLRILTKDIPYDPVFLKDFGFIKELYIFGICSTLDYKLDSLQMVPKLEHLIFMIYAKTLLDLSVLPPIKKLTLDWRKNKVVGLNQCTNLRDICVCGYKEPDFDQFRTLSKLKRISLKTGSIKNLDGLEGCQSLEILSLAGCRYLTDISKLREIPSLKSIHFESCSQIHDFSVLAKLPNLERLYFEDCKNIESIAFVRDLPQLRELSVMVSSTILDNDLTPALNVPLAQIRPRKQYNIVVCPEQWRFSGGPSRYWWYSIPIDLGDD